jgi:NTP pyrophosphatase (non-canonical NTP hydrolase)
VRIVDVRDYLAHRLRAFAAEREWERFHDPKNLAMAMASEVGELLEVFQWKTTDEVRAAIDDENLAAASEELADVLIYLVRLADVLGIDLGEAVDTKIALNEGFCPSAVVYEALPIAPSNGRPPARFPVGTRNIA